MPVRSRRGRPSRIFRHRRRRHQRRRRRRVRRRPSAASAVGAAIDGGHLLQRAARQDKASGELPVCLSPSDTHKVHLALADFGLVGCTFFPNHA